jgi:hypothetical protein
MTLRGSRRPHVVPITAPSFPTAPRTNIYRNIAYSFIAFTVIVVLAVLWLSSARATIVVQTKRTPITYEGVVDVARQPQPGQIPGRVVNGVFEKIQEFPVGSSASSVAPLVPVVPAVPVAPPSTPPPAPVTVTARGTVRIYNKYSKAQTLIRTTRLLTADQKLYRIDQTVRLQPGESIEVPVYADKPGAEFVIGPTTFTIPGLFVDLQRYIYAESTSPFQAVSAPVTTTPATSTASPSPTPIPAAPRSTTGKLVMQADLDAAEQALTQAILEQAKKTLGADLGDLSRMDVVYLVRKPERFKTNVSVGQSSDTFLASLKLDVTAVFYPKEDLLSLVRLKLKEKIPSEREFLPPATGSGLVLEIQSADAKNETANVRIKAEGAYRITPSSPGLQKTVVAGKEPQEAIAILKSIEGVDDAQVTIKPKWFGKIPSLKDRIDIKVE